MPERGVVRPRSRGPRERRNSGRIGVSSVSGPHDQVLRNQSVGSRCSGAGSGPRLVAVIWIRMSSGAGLGVFDLDVEVAVLGERLVSVISYSGSSLERLRVHRRISSS